MPISQAFEKYINPEVPVGCYSGFRRFFPSCNRPTASLHFKTLADDLADNTLNLNQLEMGLIQFIDYQDGIDSTFLEPEDYDNKDLAEDNIQSKRVYYRDATKAKPLKDRIRSDHFIHQASNLLLRSLNIVRAVEHTIEYYCDNQARREGFKKQLRAALKSLSETLGACEQRRYLFNKNQQLKTIEKTFNLAVINVLEASGLNKTTKQSQKIDKAYQKLLMHFRYLSNTLNPAAAVVTMSQYEGKQVKQVADFVTEKTGAQKLQLKHSNNFFVEGNNVSDIKHINAAFQDQIMSDETQLSPQCRFKFQDTVKQAFYETVKINEMHMKPTVRCASTAYIESDATEESKLKAAQENLIQVAGFVRKKTDSNKNIHHMTLISDSKMRRNQDKMCDIMRRAAAAFGNFSFSIMPVSFFAVAQKLFGLHKPKIDEAVLKKGEKLPSSGIPFNGAQRTRYAAEVVSKHDAQGAVLVYGCASNQNRAGTVAITRLANTLSGKKSKKVFCKAAEHVVVTGHELTVASISCPGSKGFKSESKKWGLFSRLANKFLYGGCSKSRTRVLLPKTKYLPKPQKASARQLGLFGSATLSRSSSSNSLVSTTSSIAPDILPKQRFSWASLFSPVPAPYTVEDHDLNMRLGK